MDSRLTWWRDAAERVTMTFVQGAVSAVALHRLTDLSMWQGAAMAGVTAALSMVKTVVARHTGPTDSASMIG